MRFLISGSLLIVGIAHLLPLLGVVSSERLTALYGLPFSEPNLAILMRHRAVLFGLLGSFLIFAAFRPALQPLAFLGGFASLVTFLWLAWSVGDYNEPVGRVVAVDVVVFVCLVVGFAAYGYVHIKG